ncbi:tRNA (adenosine(37)-N6)-threonylcarbamoyltransferase complex ATPase subunit type 1 TsaE [Balneolaceae bacterium YR4-1]|uniref:tRNA threonylcarbamoyladenosine biosynthesis protein TsaE n=1 Tax=Halalkalibaculum roseum TaxID=2709311 RepID=A0A6M1SXB3_9BACT|nr:tRNA (adenosine(37)-N6)-threonylcarbamoyltransferase complex ATPase subunit type 1 TsaE [Halalkalibaculum roseum]NGP77632.1 tRNA (adenosine(37)-N6)-threonylcarbamoyltransferase complex ATPase subunit type 1 TsaE [Halalkalibaculum roseum]
MSSEKEFISESEEQTKKFAADFARSLKAGDVVCLEGDLGAGKTHFVKGMVTAFGIEESDVQSPTFTLINEYPGSIPLYHFDCYRMESVHEAIEIGAEEYFYGEGVSVIEWPERIRDIIPAEAVWITITSLAPTKRKFVIQQKGT